jgi:hypothetical protein
MSNVIPNEVRGWVAILLALFVGSTIVLVSLHVYKHLPSPTIQFTGQTGHDTDFVEVVIPDEINCNVYIREDILNYTHHDTIRHEWRYKLKNTNLQETYYGGIR